MNKKLIALAVAVAFVFTAFAMPNAIFAHSGTFQEAVANFNTAKQNLQTETSNFKQKVNEAKSLSKEVHKLLKEKKEKGEAIPENVKEDLKKLRIAQVGVRKGILIRNAREEYAKKILTKIKDLRNEIKKRKEEGAKKEELKRLRRKLGEEFRDLRLVAPLSPEKMLKNADKIMQRAETLNKNGKEKEAIKLLDRAAKGFETEAKALKEREAKLGSLIELLNKVKGELSQ